MHTLILLFLLSTLFSGGPINGEYRSSKLFPAPAVDGGGYSVLGERVQGYPCRVSFAGDRVTLDDGNRCGVGVRMGRTDFYAVGESVYWVRGPFILRVDRTVDLTSGFVYAGRK